MENRPTSEAAQQRFAYGTATPPHCRDREETGVIRPGAHVRIVGLESRADLNGANGVVLDYSYQKARWAVQLQREAVRVKPANLRVDYKQPAGVPTAKSYLEKITPPGMQFMPQMPPIRFGPNFQIEKPDLEAEARSARMEVLKCGLHAAGASLESGLYDLPADLRAALQAEFPEMACQDEISSPKTVSSPQSVTAQLGKEGADVEGDASDDTDDEDDPEEAEVTANEMYAMALRGNLPCIRMLLEAGCPVDAALSGPPRGMQFMGGSTALHAACINGHLDVLNALIGAGANLNATRDGDPASDERTALHEACKEGHTACALRLVKVGAAMHLEDAFGLTPCALAKQKGHHNLAKKLENAASPKAPAAPTTTKLPSTPTTIGKQTQKDGVAEAQDLEFDQLLDQMVSLGLLSEPKLEALTDSLARGDTTKAAVLDKWSKAAQAEKRTVNSKSSQKYLYLLARASEPARDYNGRDTNRTLESDASCELGMCLINRSGAYVARDQCIRLLTAAQLRATATADFKDVADLVVLKWSKARLKESEVDIRYEARETDRTKFPYVYRGQRSRSELDYTCLVAVNRATLGSDGMHTFPGTLFRDEHEEDEDWDP